MSRPVGAAEGLVFPGKGVDDNLPSWNGMVWSPTGPGQAETPAPRTDRAAGVQQSASQGSCTPIHTGPKASPRQPFNAEHDRCGVGGCLDGQDEAEEPLLGEEAVIKDCSSKCGLRELTTGEEDGQGLGLVNWTKVSDLCSVDGSISGAACQTLEERAPSAELCPSLEQRAPATVECPSLEERAPSALCPSLQEGATSVALCQSAGVPCPHPGQISSSAIQYPLLEARDLTGNLYSNLQEEALSATPQPFLQESVVSAPANPGVAGNLGTSQILLGEASRVSVEVEEAESSEEDETAGVSQTLLGMAYGFSVEDEEAGPSQALLGAAYGISVEDEEAGASQALLGAASSIAVKDTECVDQECPICTERYDKGRRREALLNCSHAVCESCVRSIMDQAGEADIGRVRCPLCRQKTPMMKWEIQKLQDEMLERDCSRVQPAYVAPAEVPRRPGPFGALEYSFKQRFRTSRMFGCIPCLRYPLCFIEGLNALERRSRCCYLFILSLLYGAEKLCFVLPFLPIIMLVLILVFDK